MSEMLDKTLATSFLDLAHDFTELHFLFTSTIKKIDTGLKEFERKKKFLPIGVYEDITTKLSELKNSYYACADETTQSERLAKQGNSVKELELLISQKQSLSFQLRSHQLTISSLLLATDWQSPTFAHSMQSLSGRQTGEIKATINDYKRDFHLDELEYEENFTKEYIDTLMKSALYTYVVNSGMAALTTILFFLKAERKNIRSVLLGKSSYFENRELIHAAFGENVLEVGETDTESLYTLVQKHIPEVIFLDTLCNNATVTMPDIKRLLTFLIKNTSHEMTVVLDNTGLSFFLQPLTRSLLTNRRIRLIVFESLNKYHQFGTDRVTAGFIYAHGKDVGKLFMAREHTGTNITDMSTLTLTSPNRKFLKRRMLRLSRNAEFLARELDQWISEHTDSPLSAIYYPALPSHPSFAWAKKQSFSGSYFSFGFKKKYQKIQSYQTFISEVIRNAKKEKVQIVSGTSFGMDASRIYLTALRSDIAEPFVRFSVGTETEYEIEKIAAILKEAIRAV